MTGTASSVAAALPADAPARAASRTSAPSPIMVWTLEPPSTVMDEVRAPFSTVKYRLPMPSALPLLSVTDHAIVCTPLASVVVSKWKKPTAPLLFARPGNSVAMSARKLLYVGRPTGRPSMKTMIVDPSVGIVLGCGVSAHPKFV